VSASDKASGKSQKITITSDKGRLSEDEIERMVKEAEENAEADKLIRQTIDAKNQLESYLYSLRSTIDDTLKDKIEANEKEKLREIITESLKWLEDHQDETKQVYEDKRKEVEAVANPIIAKVYGSTGDNNSNDDGTPANDDGPDDSPTVEEVN
jgi:heat shock protein 5